MNFAVVASEVESQYALFSREPQPRFQIHPALKNVRGEFADTQTRMEMRLPKTRLHLPQNCQRFRFSARDALAETPRCFNLARH